MVNTDVSSSVLTVKASGILLSGSVAIPMGWSELGHLRETVEPRVMVMASVGKFSVIRENKAVSKTNSSGGTHGTQSENKILSVILWVLTGHYAHSHIYSCWWITKELGAHLNGMTWRKLQLSAHANIHWPGSENLPRAQNTHYTPVFTLIPDKPLVTPFQEDEFWGKISISEQTEVFAASFEKPALHLQSVRVILSGEEYEFGGQSAHPPSTPYLLILHASHSPVIVSINPSTHVQLDSDQRLLTNWCWEGNFYILLRWAHCPIRKFGLPNSNHRRIMFLVQIGLPHRTCLASINCWCCRQLPDKNFTNLCNSLYTTPAFQPAP